MRDSLDLSKGNLKRFGRTMFLCLSVAGLLLFLKHTLAYTLLWGIGVVFLLLGQILPAALKPAYILWMGAAFCLGWINTRIVILALYYFILVPIGLIAKLCRKDFLDLKLDPVAKTYWQKRSPQINAGKRYEKIY